MQGTGFTCSVCGTSIQTDGIGITTGYGYNEAGEKVCFACCAEADKAWMREHGRIALYLVEPRTGEPQIMRVTNWPGSLSLAVKRYRRSRHNWLLWRTDVWFDFEGREWHGYQIGNHTQICHCRQTKREARP